MYPIQNQGRRPRRPAPRGCLPVALLAALAVALGGCGQDDMENVNEAAQALGLDQIIPDGRPGKTDGRIAPYVARFEAEVGVDTGDVVATFTDGGGQGGTCAFLPDGRRWIQVNRDYWDGYATTHLPAERVEDMREQILFHELGHCALDMNHKSWKRPLKLPSGATVEVPGSIMYPDVSVAFWRERRPVYIEELREAAGTL